jgi:hypothetical protein
MGGAGQFDVSGPGNDSLPPQEFPDASTQFHFVPGPLAPYTSTGLTRSQRPRMPQAQATTSYTGPQEAQHLRLEQAPSMRWPSQAHLPLQETFMPPPGFPQPPLNPGHTFYPGVELPRAQAENIRPTHRQSLPPGVTPRRSGYHFEPGRGYICHVFSTCVVRPGVHRNEAQRSFCSASGPEVREDDEADNQRMPHVAKMER